MVVGAAAHESQVTPLGKSKENDMAKIERTKTVTERCQLRITVADLAKRFHFDEAAAVTVVSADGAVTLDEEATLLVEWSETKPVRTRKKGGK